LAWPLPSLGPVIRRRTSAHSALDAVLLRFRNAHVRRRRLNWSRNTPAVWRSISACAPALNLREKLCQIRDARCGSAGCGGHSRICMTLRKMPGQDAQCIPPGSSTASLWLLQMAQSLLSSVRPMVDPVLIMRWMSCGMPRLGRIPQTECGCVLIQSRLRKL
jgi:hypothetical protein